MSDVRLRAVSWDGLYDGAGRGIVSRVRKLLRVRRSSAHLRGGAHFYFDDWNRYQRLDVLLFARYDAQAYSLIAINTIDSDVQVPFWFPIAGDCVEELHGGAFGSTCVQALAETQLVVAKKSRKCGDGRRLHCCPARSLEVSRCRIISSSQLGTVL